MSTGLARVTINAPQRRVDVALPEQVPLADLLPDVLQHAGEGLADDGERHGGWVLRRADGAALLPGQALSAQGVRDGELLHLVPAREHWPEWEYDDVVEAIAQGVRRRGAAWSGAATRIATRVAASALLTVGLFAVWHGGSDWGLGGAAGLGVAVLLLSAGVAASRAYGDARVGTMLGGWALPYAFTGGALLVASGDPIGPFGSMRWLGAPEALTGSVALLLVALLGLVGVAAGLRIFAAGVSVGVLGALTALGGFFLSAAGMAAILASVLACGIGILPLLAIRLGKLPIPPVTLPDAANPSGSRDRPDRRRVLAAVARTEDLLTGLLMGHAVLAAVAALLLIAAGGVAGRLLAGVCAVALLLRSRLFAAVRHRVPLVAAGFTSFALLGLELIRQTDQPLHLLTFVIVGVLLALLTVAAGATYSKRPPSPYLGRLADVVDLLAMVSVVPLACAVLGLYARARGLLG